MRIGFTTRVKQGDLVEAIQQRGWTQKKCAEFLGLRQDTFNKFINLKWVPEEFSPELTIKLAELTGKTPEQLFPEFARQREFLAMPKVSTRILEITPGMLKSRDALFFPAPQVEIVSRHELRAAISDALRSLTPREEKIVREIVMDDETEESMAERLGLSTARVHQIKQRAIRILRHPDRSNKLRPFVG